MRAHKKRIWPLCLTAVLMALLTCLAFGKFVFHPNKYILNDGGDAYKNYFTPAWYVANDHGLHFTGMNYPYGDHVVFTDDQPVISLALNWIDDHLFPISAYTAGILNMLIFISLVSCACFLFLILRHYHLPVAWAVITALLITMMSPQIERFWGHYALSYTVFIPCTWYLAIRQKAKNYSFGSGLLLFLVLVFFGLIHLYYLLIATLFRLSWIVIRAFRKPRMRWRSITWLSVETVLPLLFVLGFMKLTDPVGDRPSTPYGFFTYKATFQSVFLPKNGTLHNFFTHTLHFRQTDPEGYGYIGIAADLILIASLVLLILRRVRKKRKGGVLLHLPEDLGIFLGASVITLLFSMTFPFNLGFQFLLDILTPLKQFRSPGRFSWIFYYVVAVYGAVLVYMIFRRIRRKHRIIAYVFLLLPLLLEGSDAAIYFFTTGKKLSAHAPANSLRDGDPGIAALLRKAGYVSGDFQCIFYVPAFFQGSEKLYVDRTNGSYTSAMRVAYALHLPLMDCMMSRTSLSQTLALASLDGDPALAKNLPPEMNDKPILLIGGRGDYTAGEHFLESQAQPLGQAEGLDFFALRPRSILQGQQHVIVQFDSLRDSLRSFTTGGISYLSTMPLEFLYRNGFDDMPVADPFLGTGALEANGNTFIADVPVDIRDSIWVELSFWARSGIQTTAYPYVKAELRDAGGGLIRRESVTPKLSTDILGNWVRASGTFILPPSCRTLHLSTNKDRIDFDELMIRHTAADIYYDVRSGSSFMVDNYPVGLR